MGRAILIVWVLAGFLGAVADHAAGQTAAADGEQVYATICARCHDDTLPRMPTRDALRERSARQIQTAMTSGARSPSSCPTNRPGTLDSPLSTLPDTALLRRGHPNGGRSLSPGVERVGRRPEQPAVSIH